MPLDPILVGSNYRIKISAESNVFFNVSAGSIDISESTDSITVLCLEDITNDSLSIAMTNFVSDYLLNGATIPIGAKAAAMLMPNGTTIVIAGNEDFMDIVRDDYVQGDSYSLLEGVDNPEITKGDYEFCSTPITINLVCSTSKQYNFADSILEIPSAIDLHPEMALLSYMATEYSSVTDSTTKAECVSASINNICARCYKYLDENDFWVPTINNQENYQNMNTDSGWSLPNFNYLVEKKVLMAKWPTWIGTCSANYYNAKDTFTGYDTSTGTSVNLISKGYQVIPANPGNN